MQDQPDFYQPIYYSIIKRPFLRFAFPGLADIQINHSQLHQDLFVLCVLGGKRDGVYCEIGAHEPIFISNTYLLEQHFGWRGLGFEWDGEMVARHQKLRRNPCLQADALTVDFRSCMEAAGLPDVIDYLSVDIDPPENTLAALKRLPHDRYRFRVITFEHDYSLGGVKERTESREFLSALGYQLLVSDVSWGSHVVEDWWVDPGHTDAAIIHALAPEVADGIHPHDQYFYHLESFPGSPAYRPPQRHPRGEGICVEGWRDLNHSYSLVNQWQLLELLRHPVKLRHRDLTPFRPGWTSQRNGSGLPEELQQRLRAIPAPQSLDYFSVIYRIAFPLNLQDGPAERILVFGTSEYGNCHNFFVGATPAEAIARGNLQIVTPSLWSKAGFLAAGFREQDIVVLPHGVAPSMFCPVEPDLRSFYRQLFGFAPDDFVLLNLGALTRNKGVDLLLLAYAKLKPRYPQLKLVLKDLSHLYGRTLEDVLEDMADLGMGPGLTERQRQDVVCLSDNLDLDGLRALYTASDLYVSPYRAEGFNLPPLEAAACGVPILVTAGGATDDYFSPLLGLQIASQLHRQDDTMVLVPDLDSLEKAIETMLLQPGQWGGRAGSEHVHGAFSWEVIGRRLVDLLGSG